MIHAKIIYLTFRIKLRINGKTFQMLQILEDIKSLEIIKYEKPSNMKKIQRYF